MAKGTPAMKKTSETRQGPATAQAKGAPVKPVAADDAPAIALDLGPANLSPAMQAYFQKCQDKLGFVPNVLVAYAFDTAKLEAFAAMYNDLMLAPSGLSKLEREMIAVAVSSQNRCYY
ncbi:MAG TPA: carboxymuconolactone decarboxylase family protein, partial [Pseudolabrys sp.]